MPPFDNLPERLSDAVGDSIPTRYKRTFDVVVSDDARYAAALVWLNPGPDQILMVSLCERHGAEWHELSLTDIEGVGKNWMVDRWVWYAVGAAPTNARSVQVTYDGIGRSRAITEGVYFVAIWPPGPAATDQDPSEVSLSFNVA